ncbi:MAG TPA: hypothetical protein VF421_04105, partial [Niabella sp.]
MKKVSKIISSKLLVLFTVLLLIKPGSGMASDIELQDKKLKVVFDSETGAITKLENVQTGWVINRRAALGISFRMHAPLADRRFNYIYGQKQHAVVNKVSDSQIRFEWTNLKSENGGVLPLIFTATVTLADGRLTFDSKLVNNSAL